MRGVNLNLVNNEAIIFDWLKFFLLGQVVLGHIVALGMPSMAQIDGLGGFAYWVIMAKAAAGFGRESAFQFIFLSGFFSAPSLLGIHDAPSLLAALRKRGRRLYPALVISLVFTAALDSLGGLFTGDVYAVNGLHYNAALHQGMRLFWANVLGLQPTWARTYGSNGALWTLGYLIQYYFLTALALHGGGSRFVAAILTALILLALALLPAEFGALYLLWLLGLGMRRRFASPLLKVYPGLAVLLAALLFGLSKWGGYVYSLALSPLLGLVLLAAVKAFARQFVRIFALMSARRGENRLYNPRRWADWMFLIYVTHLPVLFFAAAAAAELRWPAPGFFVGFAVVAAFGIVAAASISHKLLALAGPESG